MAPGEICRYEKLMQGSMGKQRRRDDREEDGPKKAHTRVLIVSISTLHNQRGKHPER